MRLQSGTVRSSPALRIRHSRRIRLDSAHVRPAPWCVGAAPRQGGPQARRREHRGRHKCSPCTTRTSRSAPAGADPSFSGPRRPVPSPHHRSEDSARELPTAAARPEPEQPVRATAAAAALRLPAAGTAGRPAAGRPAGVRLPAAGTAVPLRAAGPARLRLPAAGLLAGSGGGPGEQRLPQPAPPRSGADRHHGPALPRPADRRCDRRRCLRARPGRRPGGAFSASSSIEDCGSYLDPGYQSWSRMPRTRPRASSPPSF